MKKRLLACVLSLSLLFNLSVPAFATDEQPLPCEFIEDVYIYSQAEIPDDIYVNPEDYILDSGISSGSLGLTLSIGQIALLIAAGGGAIYASQYADDLGRQLEAKLAAAAAAIPSGPEILAQWMIKAGTGVIEMASAPSWIAQAILQYTYGLVTNVAPLMGNPYSGKPAAPMKSYDVVPAGSPVYYGVPRIDSVTGEVTRHYYTFEFDVVPVVLTNYMNDMIYVWTAVMPVNGEWNGNVYCSANPDKVYSLRQDFSWKNITSNTHGFTRYFFILQGQTTKVTSDFLLQAFYTYCQPGSFVNNSDSVYWGTFINYFQNYIDDVIGSPTYDYPEDEAIDPGILVGGMPDVWVGQGLGADVIKFPDILVDGTGILTPDATLTGDAAIDAAIEAALEKLAVGELTWTDFWMDLSKTGAVPTVQIKDTTTGDLVDRPIGDDGTLKDPVVVPEYSTDPNKYSIDLKRFFPFCIPFDLYNFFCCLAADPETPVFNLSIPVFGYSYDFTVDLSPFDDVAALVRNFELFLFIIILATTTRDNMIKG